ncbi:uncharacterized protein DMAD_04619 [Drosophila madeirensis]|uniref:Uncharacterized protein n=1 Tax=Drosophila madeirensis TaxID=30013 RepID=A0AAU9GD37_DROMD
MISRPPTMLMCARMVNRCVTHCLANKSEATLEPQRRFSQACLVKKTASQCEYRAIGTAESTSKEQMLDQLFQQDEVEAAEEYNPAEDSVSVKTLRAGDTSAAEAITFQPRKDYHDIRRSTSRESCEDKDAASAAETTNDYDLCISRAVDDIIAGCPVSDAGWFHESWNSYDAECPLAADGNAEQSVADKAVQEQATEEGKAETSQLAGDESPEVWDSTESNDLAGFAQFLESIQDTKSIAASEIEALFKEYITKSNAQVEGQGNANTWVPDRSVYDECMNQAAENTSQELTASTLPADLSVYREATDASEFRMHPQWINEKGVPVDEPVAHQSQEPTAERGANQLYLDDLQNVWQREPSSIPTTTYQSAEVFNEVQDIDIDIATAIDDSTEFCMSAKKRNTETADRIFFEKMQSVWDQANQITDTENEHQSDAITDFTEFLRRESEAPEAIDPTVQAYRPFRIIEVPADMTISSSKVSTGLDASQNTQPRPAVPIAAGKAGEGMQKLPTDKPTVSKGDGAREHRMHTKLTEKQSHTLVVLALQLALDELKSGKANLKTKITFTKP